MMIVSGHVVKMMNLRKNNCQTKQTLSYNVVYQSLEENNSNWNQYVWQVIILPEQNGDDDASLCICFINTLKIFTA